MWQSELIKTEISITFPEKNFFSQMIQLLSKLPRSLCLDSALLEIIGADRLLGLGKANRQQQVHSKFSHAGDITCKTS